MIGVTISVLFVAIDPTDMDPKISALERAFQLARSGRIANVDDIKKMLKRAMAFPNPGTRGAISSRRSQRGLSGGRAGHARLWETDRPEEIEKYTLFHLVGDMVGVVSALGENKAVIVGHDWVRQSRLARRALPAGHFPQRRGLVTSDRASSRLGVLIDLA